MKLTIGLSAALASFAAAAAQEAAEQAAQVYILRGSHPSWSTESLTPSEARLILDQRLAPEGEGPSFRDIPDTTGQERIVDLINKYGKEPVQLFTEKDAIASPHQLVVVVQGMPRAEYESHFGWRLHTQPDFTVSNTREKLGQNKFYDASIAKQHGCSLSKAVDPSEESCWNGKSTLATYDRSEDADHPTTFLDELPKLEKLAESGKLETTLVFLPEGEASNSKPESDDEQELRRRQAETVITSVEENNAEPPAETSSVADNPVFSSVPSVVPACFQSEDSCIQSTANCSRGHGLCQNKYAKNDGSDGKDVCYSCHCLSTVSEKGGVTHWAGGACSKQDISVQFWLFAGFTLAMVSVLYLAIGMLFSVGEEKLPGVIGAGVSRSK